MFEDSQEGTYGLQLEGRNLSTPHETEETKPNEESKGTSIIAYQKEIGKLKASIRILKNEKKTLKQEVESLQHRAVQIGEEKDEVCYKPFF